MSLLTRATALAMLLIGAASVPAHALEKLEKAIYRVDFKQIDDLLKLDSTSVVRVLVVERRDPKAVSGSHVAITRKWVESGGVLWAVEDGLRSTLTQQIVRFNSSDFAFKKAGSNKAGGELVMRGASPKLVIHDHALTTGVDQLYLYPRYRFDGTTGAEPLVEMTDSKGNQGIVLAVVRVGSGLVVLDGTARSKGGHLFMGGMPGFNSAHPNSAMQNGTWNPYDWSRLMANARSYADSAFAPKLPPAAPAATTGP
jgi:hypothetical protein